MAGYEKAMFSICEQCKNEFTTSAILYNSVNTSIKQGMTEDFLNDKLNVVTCPICKSSFIYERPFVAFSTTKNYAIYANNNITDGIFVFGKIHLYNMLNMNNMKFRLVSFQHEASEKARIFEAGLCDIKVEILKKQCFNETYFKNKLENFVVFSKLENDSILFEYRNFLQNVIETKEVTIAEYNKISVESVKGDHSPDIKWIRI